MSVTANPIVETYSRLAREYDEDANFLSCWGRASERALSSIHLRDDYKLVVDMGCGTGRAVHALAAGAPAGAQFIAIDPAENMCHIAAQKTSGQAVQVLQGSFEKIPLETASVDYLYSILAFHWVTNLDAAVAEVARVLKPDAEMDLFFIGRDNGREFPEDQRDLLETYGTRSSFGFGPSAQATDPGSGLAIIFKRVRFAAPFRR
jgi:ubiquinone/menaquinone biosynthesis C-methylase UbiE